RRSTVGNDRDQLLRLEPAQRLPHRGPAHLHHLAQLGLDEPLTRPEVAREYGVAELVRRLRLHRLRFDLEVHGQIPFHCFWILYSEIVERCGRCWLQLTASINRPECPSP